eukprot:scaffold22713_cov139-Cylindrotheca_fusiformis.AAC.12
MTGVVTASLLSSTSRAFVSYRGRLNQLAMRAASSQVDDTQLVQDMLYRIRRINNMPDDVRSNLVEFQVDGSALGKLRPNIAQMLCKTDTGSPPTFEIRNEESERPILTFSSEVGPSADERTSAVSLVMDRLRQDGVVTGWRDELYPVAESFYCPPKFLMERAAVTLLGVLEYGVHINGIVQESRAQSPKMWIARRSKDKSKFPGMLDHIVAGGQPAGLSLMENCIKECEEEAGIPESIAKAGIQAAGAISYETWDSESDKVTRCVLFNYDLYLPSDFKPKPVDGEVEGFLLWDMDQVKESIARDYDDPIKPNCYVVIIDYLLRTGQVSPEASGYLDVLRELRSGDCR